jgi:hypothetical protein
MHGGSLQLDMRIVHQATYGYCDAQEVLCRDFVTEYQKAEQEHKTSFRCASTAPEHKRRHLNRRSGFHVQQIS